MRTIIRRWLRLVPLAFAVTACGPKPPACTAESRGALLELYKAASDRAIESGACDAYTKVDDCPAYMVVEARFTAAEAALCRK